MLQVIKHGTCEWSTRPIVGYNMYMYRYIDTVLFKALHTHFNYILRILLYPIILKHAWKLGLGRYGQQPYRYLFDTDLANTIRIRYDAHVHDLRF